jgi:ABC-type methionine transport system permease subunit
VGVKAINALTRIFKFLWDCYVDYLWESVRNTLIALALGFFSFYLIASKYTLNPEFIEGVSKVLNIWDVIPFIITVVTGVTLIVKFFASLF